MDRAKFSWLGFLILFTFQSYTESSPNIAVSQAPSQIPDLTWEPKKFEPVLQELVRYIDYENGHDSNPGTREKPWKHHPWDTNATGRSARSTGIATYVFKNGVVYRGQLVARESGTLDTPVRLTSDPAWGTGSAILSGAESITFLPQQCGHNIEKLLPFESRSKTYCATIKYDGWIHRLWHRDNAIIPVRLARYPNWNEGGFPDPRYEWLELGNTKLEMVLGVKSTNGINVGDALTVVTPDIRSRSRNHIKTANQLSVHAVDGNQITVLIDERPSRYLRKGIQLTNGMVTTIVTESSGTHTLIRRLHDKANLSDDILDDMTGGVIRVERPSTQQLTTGTILGNDIANGYLRADLRLPPESGPESFDRYFLEGLPQFLNSADEFSVVADKGRSTIITRTHDDIEPKQLQLEVPLRPSIIEIVDKNHIQISGLEFQFVSIPQPGTRESRHTALHSAAIQIRGNSTNIGIYNSSFKHLESGIVAYPTGRSSLETLDNIHIADNIFERIDGSPIALGNGHDRASHVGTGRLIQIDVHRNRIMDSGLLSSTHWGIGSIGHGIDISGAEIAEVSFNHTLRTGGSGINVYMGNLYEKSGRHQPFLRGRIHHNKVSHSLMAAQDFGGIESWLGGPMFIYNNISINPIGYRHGRSNRGIQQNSFKNSSYGVGIYLDGQYKSYVFNNIVWGYENDPNQKIYNAAAFNEAMGFLNTVFNNTFMGFAVGIHKGMTQHNRGLYLGNLILDMGHSFILQEPRSHIEYTSLAFTNNIFSGNPAHFGHVGRSSPLENTLEGFRTSLENNQALAFDTGSLSHDQVIRDPAAPDFRLKKGSPAIDAGVKVFVPWPLARVVGEWNFYQSAEPGRILDESINMNNLWINRNMFHDIPRSDLNCPHTQRNDYVPGILEDWIAGALSFDGKRQYCSIRNSTINAGFNWTDTQTGQQGYIQGSERDTVDIDKEDFVIETVISARLGSTSGIISKENTIGYRLDIDSHGRLIVYLNSESHTIQARSQRRLTDGHWHHVLVEVDRSNERRITFFIDGVHDSTHAMTGFPAEASLNNSGDFFVGKSSSGSFMGKIDFVRIAKSTMTDAKTNIHELYDWSFNGPHLQDFTGSPISGIRRDAGAIEFQQ